MLIEIKNINPNKLHDELITAGILPVLVNNDLKKDEYIAENTWVEVADDVDMVTVQTVIDAHDPSPFPKQATTEERLKMAEDTILGLMDIITMGGI